MSGRLGPGLAAEFSIKDPHLTNPHVRLTAISVRAGRIDQGQRYDTDEATSQNKCDSGPGLVRSPQRSAKIRSNQANATQVSGQRAIVASSAALPGPNGCRGPMVAGGQWLPGPILAGARYSGWTRWSTGPEKDPGNGPGSTEENAMGSGDTTEANWWTHTPVYQVYPRSFADSNGDGIGDISGIIERLDHLVTLGVGAVWISPFFVSPQQDFGYDIADYERPDPTYGSDADVDLLITRCHDRNIRVIFDLVLNHTSIQHPWFTASRRSRTDPFRDWYVWRPGRGPGGRLPPNNWRNMLGGRGWHRDHRTGEWYWAAFLPFQPDLNWRNPAVRQAMNSMIRMWLDRGVDGFRLDIFNALFEDERCRPNPRALAVPREDGSTSWFQRNVHNLDHPDTLAFALELRTLIDGYDPPRMLVGEVFGNEEHVARYCHNGAGLNLVFCFETVTTPLKASRWRSLLQRLDTAFPPPMAPTWVHGNHDRPRRLASLSRDQHLMLFGLQIGARGVPFIYQGEEIGLPEADNPPRHGLDPVARKFRWSPGAAVAFARRKGLSLNRDNCRTPMRWDRTEGLGFSSSSPWLPSGPADWPTVADQEADPTSRLNGYRELLALRSRLRALQVGAQHIVAVPDASPLVGIRRTVPPSQAAGREESLDARDIEIWANMSDGPVAAPVREDATIIWRSRPGQVVGHGAQTRNARPATETLAAFEVALFAANSPAQLSIRDDRG